MKKIVLLSAFWIALSPFAFAAEPDASAGMVACRQRQAVIAQQAQGFQGEQMIKRLIDADLQRASREAAEGDDDECLEALDHATKLLAGEY